MRSEARPLAIVDTSFWSIAVRIGVLPALLDELRLAAPQAVRAEILAEDPRRPRTRPDYQDAFADLESQFVSLPDPEPDPVQGLDPGEASVVGCARALSALALINERRGRRVADALGVTVVDVPSAVILLAARGSIDVGAAREFLARTRRLNSTPAEQLAAAELIVDDIERASHHGPGDSRDRTARHDPIR